jgi:coenzyme F420 hydrogenase subunit beta
MQKENEGIGMILASDLCISCGACVHICVHRNIEMEFNRARGKWNARVRKPEDCQRCKGDSICLSVCPSYNVNYMELAGSQENGLLGRIKNVYNGYAKDPSLRFSSSSGGFIRVLCNTLYNKKEIDGAITIMHDGGLEYFPQIVTNFDKMPNSIYHNINYQNAIDLIKRNGGKYLLIGLPCQITGVELFMRKSKDQHLRERIYSKISLLCGYTFDRKNIQAFANYYGFPLKEVSYRVGGRFRKTRLINGSKTLLIDAVHPGSLKDKINNMIGFDQIMVQNACLFCVDHLCYCADLVVGDAWQRRYNEDQLGTNIIISRTELGEEIVSKMNLFHFEKGNQNEIIESQGPKYALGSIGEGMREANLGSGYFFPNRRRTENLQDIVVHRFSVKDVIKIKMIKKWLLKERFRMAKYVYVLLEGRILLLDLLKRRLKEASK